MRVVSACYRDFYPFHFLSEDHAVAVDPDDLQAGDVLIIWGGADISPSLYNKGRSSFSGAGDAPSTRDRMEWDLLQRNIALGNHTIGVCRGAQMLCAAAGGTLYQHVDNHVGSHEVVTNDGKEFVVNSIHHQMMNLDGTDHDLIAWSKHIRSNRHIDVSPRGEDVNLKVDIEPELVYFKAIKGLAPQWHPEMLRESDVANTYLFNKIKQLFV